jgi:hypothetical protein
MKAVVTGVDTYRWVDAKGVTHSADRGDEIDVSSEEFARVPGALSKPGENTQRPTLHAALDALAEEAGVNFPQHVRTPAEKLQFLEQEGVDVDSGAPSAELGYPKTQRALDEFAQANAFTWPDGVKTVAEKQAALAAAGVQPPASS